MIRSWLRVLSALAMSFVLLECKQPAPLRPQFVYVANFYSNLVSAYSIGSNGALTPVPGSPFGEDAAVGPVSVAVTPRPSSPTWQTDLAATSRPTASVPTGL